MTASEINVHVLLALVAVIAGAHAAGWVVARVGQPRVHGEILAGIILGPSVLGLLWPSAGDYLFPAEVLGPLRAFAQVGLVLFMFLIGLDLDLEMLRSTGRKALVISQSSIVAPIGLGVLLGIWVYPRLGDGVDRATFTLFMGAAMAITAFPVLARVLQETGLTHTRIGVLAITCAAIDDVTAWCVLAVVIALAQSSGSFDVVRVVVLSLVYLLAMQRVLKPFLVRLRSLPIWAVVCLTLASAWTTEQIGTHAIFGAFIAGVVAPRRPELHRQIHERLEPAVLIVMLPVFFVVVGLSTRVDLLDSTYLWAITALVIATAVAGKWGGSMLAARAVGESWRDAAAIGVLMNTRGLTELVILTVGLELRVITPTIFTIMVLMALVTTLMATPLLALISPIYHRGMTSSRDSPKQIVTAGDD